MKVNYSLVFFIGHYLNLLIQGNKVDYCNVSSEIKYTDARYVWRHLLKDSWTTSLEGPRQAHINFIQLVIDEVHERNTHRAFQEADVYRPVRELCLKLENDLRTILKEKVLDEAIITGTELNELISQWLVDMAAIE